MKKIMMLCAVLLCCTGMHLFAQDSFFDDIDMAESTTTNEGMSAGSSESGSGNAGSIDFSGFANLGIRMYPHKDLKRTEALPVFGINFKYSGARTELDSHFKCNALTIADYPLDLIDEFTVRAYLGDFVLSTGKMKLVWGRGDMLHVLDVFNANDFTDFTIPAYIDRRIAEPMVHCAYNAPIPLRLEAVWTPLMTPDRFAKEGAWVPPHIAEIKQKARASIDRALAAPGITPSVLASLKKAGEVIENFSFDERAKIGMNAFMPDMHHIKYGQYGIRLSGSAGPVDMACQYYYGHYKTPSVNAEKMIRYAMGGKNIRECVYYDPVHIFGADLGAAIAMFNFKSEAAYYMTEDFKGTDPAVHNNSFQWVLGFDVDIPLNNLNLNIQNIGSHILGFKDAKQNNKDGKLDMDWNTAEKSTNNKLVCKISDSWLHNDLEDSVTVVWGIEHNDVVVMPKIKYKIKDEFYIEGAGAYVYAKDEKSEFSSWKNNHFVQLSFEYKF